MTSRRYETEAGFSLIEVIVSLGLMAGVLLSVAGLFILGERQVARGRHDSTALASAQTILEEIGAWSHEATWERFGLAGDAATYSIDTRVNAFAAKWQPHLQDVLGDGRAEIRLESCDGADLVDTDAIRVVVRVVWAERTLGRDAELALVRN